MRFTSIPLTVATLIASSTFVASHGDHGSKPPRNAANVDHNALDWGTRHMLGKYTKIFPHLFFYIGDERKNFNQQLY